MCNCSTVSSLNRQGAAIVLILIVDLLWVSSSELTQSIFHNASYNHPFFLSYFNTSLFTIYALFFFPLFTNSFQNWRQSQTSSSTPTHIQNGFKQHRCAPTLSQSVIRIEALETHNLRVNGGNCGEPDVPPVCKQTQSTPSHTFQTYQTLQTLQTNQFFPPRPQKLKVSHETFNSHSDAAIHLSPDVSTPRNYSHSASFEPSDTTALLRGKSASVSAAGAAAAAASGCDPIASQTLGNDWNDSKRSNAAKNASSDYFAQKIAKLTKMSKVFHPKESRTRDLATNSANSANTKNVAKNTCDSPDTTIIRLKPGRSVSNSKSDGIRSYGTSGTFPGYDASPNGSEGTLDTLETLQAPETKGSSPEINFSTHACCIRRIPDDQLSLWSTLKLSSIFCLIWFFMTFTFNVSLNYTSVASNSIISNMSSPFCWVLSLLFLKNGNEGDSHGTGMKFKVSAYNVIGILVTVAGSVAIACLDSNASGEERGWSGMVFGDVLALVSAFIYALYVTLIKKKIGNESRVNMFLFFGFIGVVNLLILWPFVIILDVLEWETFVMPSLEVWALLVVNGLLTVFSDYLWAQSILLSTPLVATVGLSLQMPIAMGMDEIFRHETHSVLYWLSALAVWLGFLFVNLDVKKQQQSQEQEQAQAQGMKA